MASNQKYYCQKCGRTLDSKEFYQSRNIEKYPPDGHLPLCKKCLTLHLDNWDPSTYLPILEMIDVPYVKKQWDSLLEKYGKDIEKLSGTTILGRYLATMRMNQYKDDRWADTERLAKKEEAEKRQALEKAGKTEEEIAEILAEDHTPEKPIELIAFEQNVEVADLPIPEPEVDEYEDLLTQEDRNYLRLKWGKQYSSEQWIKLEQLYNDMCGSYEISKAGDRDALILICKASVKANELINENDIEGFQKMSKVYDSLMKSSKLTAAQNKKDNADVVNSVGELVAMCEKEGFIPRYYIEQPNDKVDRTIEDYQNYVHRLIVEEMGLGTLIEKAIKDIEHDRAVEAKAQAGGNLDEDEIFEKQFFETNEDDPLTEEDLLEYQEFLEDGDA